MSIYIKRIISFLPKRVQQELKRYYFWSRIVAGSFDSDEPEFKMLPNFISEGDWVIDVGANVGHYTCAFSKLVGSQGRVFAFEPSAENFELLSSNVNRVGLHNVTLVNAAASERFDTFGLSIPQFKSGLVNYYMASLDKNTSQNIVVALALDSFAFTKPIRLIKVDVEGHELEALSGMKAIIEKFHPRLIVEGKDASVVSFLEGYGYSQQSFPGSPNTLYTVEEKISSS